MELLLFGGYLILFCWLVTKVDFFNRSGLTKAQIIILFLVKVIAGIFYGWTGVYYGNMAQLIDTWVYHYESLQQFQLLQQHPSRFFTEMFTNYHQDSFFHFLSSRNSWWNDLKGTFFTKLLAIFDVFSFGRYYVNVIFYNFLAFFGPIALYRVMKDAYPNRNAAVLIAVFFVPSCLYWTSGLHKEGLILEGLGFVVYGLYFILKERQVRWTRIIMIFFGLVLITILRNFLIFTLLAALFAWIVADRYRKLTPLLTYGILYALFLTAFFCAGYISPRFDLPAAVVTKQKEFLDLKGGESAVKVTPLKPTASGFLNNLPEALSLSTLRPLPSDVHHLLSMAAAVEICLLVLLFLLFVLFHTRQTAPTPFTLFCLFLSFSILVMIGYSVNILGAIVRYRSIVFPFLLAPLMANINWQKIFRAVSANITERNNV